ncbi:MAG TPA: membrane protease subunit [Clostridia bacterium]
MDNDGFKHWKLLIISSLLFVGFWIVWFIAIAPVYNVWAAGLAGQATLKQADFDRQTKVVEAKANEEAQVYNAQAEVARARGVAQANNIIKDSITEMYIRYLWVNTLDKTNNQIIYVPEGADGLPITEAGRVTVPSK